MASSPTQFDAADLAARLGRDADALPWPQRRAAAKSAAEALERGEPAAPLLALLELLAADPKWEVRKDVADCLLLVDEDQFPRLAAALADDDNAFVQQAAQRALDRRRRGRESSRRRRRGLDQLEREYQSLEQTHGPLAAERARSIAEQLYDVLVGATVHDMRNFVAPMKSAIHGMLGQLADGKVDPLRFEKQLQKVARQAGMIERMLEDMRAYAQPTPAERRRERVKDMVWEANVAAIDAFGAVGRNVEPVTVEIRVPDDLWVEAARCDMVRALMNLVKNAYEAHASGPEGFDVGTVWITARRCDGGRIEIVFRDDGMGLAEDELREVRRFVPGGTSKKTYGTGFGLPTAKRKIEAHGGSLAIESREDRGTTVTVTMPIDSEGGTP